MTDFLRGLGWGLAAGAFIAWCWCMASLGDPETGAGAREYPSNGDGR